MRNLRIKIISLFLVFINLFLIISGLILVQVRKDNIIDEFVDSFTSKQFVYYSTDGATNDWEEMVGYFDVELDSEGKDIHAQNRNEFSNEIYTNKLAWEDLMELIRWITASGYYNPTLIENPYGISLIILLDQGGNAWKPILEELFEVVFPLVPILSVIPVGIAAATVASILNPLTTEADGETGIGLEEGVGIDLITFNEIFVYEEEVNGDLVEATYDFSDGVQMEEFNGKNDGQLGIQNWNKDEIKDFFSHGYINLDVRNETGNYYLSTMIYKLLGTENNSLFILNEFANNSMEKYSENNLISYSNLSLVDKGSNVVLQNNSSIINSDGEAVYYSIWKNMDYAKYFNKALESDGFDNYSNSIAVETQPFYYENETFSGTEDILWEKGQTETTFGKFLLINKNFRPFLRSCNYTDFLNEFATTAMKDIKLSELPKQ